jgi:hypothetical protein
MKLINQNSLAGTLNNYYAAVYSGKTISGPEKKKLAQWIASRQGQKYTYCNMPAPTEYDHKNGFRLFTGEKIDMKASIGHILGEESLRALYLLNVNDKTVQAAIINSRKGINKAIKFNTEKLKYPLGWFCCGKCSAAYWRNLSAEGIDKNRSIFKSGMKVLNKMRDGKGKWHRFPFYYTVFSLTGIDLPETKAELAYAEAGLLRIMRKSPKNIYDRRKQMIAKMALEMI